MKERLVDYKELRDHDCGYSADRQEDRGEIWVSEAGVTRLCREDLVKPGLEVIATVMQANEKQRL